MKPKPLLALNHFTVPCSLLTAYSFLSAGLRLSTTLSYLMPQVPAPQQSRGRLQSFVGKTAKRSANKKMAASVPCDALLPKGDTEQQNAKQVPRFGGRCKDFGRVVECKRGGAAGDRRKCRLNGREETESFAGASNPIRRRLENSAVEGPRRVVNGTPCLPESIDLGVSGSLP